MKELKEELDDLKLSIKLPRLYMSNYFEELRVQIDYLFASQKLTNSNKACWKLNDKINDLEKLFLSNISDKVLNETLTNDVKHNVKKIQNEIGMLNQDKTRLQIIHDAIIAEKIKIGKTIFSNQTILLTNELISNDVSEDLDSHEVKLIIIKDEHISKSLLKRVRAEYDSLTKSYIFVGTLTNIAAIIKYLIDTIDSKSAPILEVYLNSFNNLVLKSNKIDSIENYAFYNLKNLEFINLESNLIRSINRNSFWGLEKLKRLNLRNNKIEFFQNNCFSELKLLEEVDLSYNPVKYFDSAILNDLVNLTVLRLESIGLETLINIQNCVFLKEIYLSNNKLRKIDLNAFVRTIYIEKLYLDSNLIKKIDKNTSRCFSHLKILDLKSNKIRAGVDLVASLTSLQELHLSNNPIGSFDFAILKDLVNLKILSLRGIGISAVESNAFRSLTQLRVLNLSENKITNLEQNMFSGLSNLKILFLSYNCIKEIKSYSFLGLQSIEKLYLQFNEIKSFDTKSLNELLNLEIVHLGYNPLLDNKTYRTFLLEQNFLKNKKFKFRLN